MLSYHAEYAKIDRFSELVNLLGKKLLRINLPMIPGKWTECVAAYDHLKSLGVNVVPKPLIENFGVSATSMSLMYSTSQLSWIQSHADQIANISFYDKAGNVIQKTNASAMLARKQTNFKGWQCESSKNSLSIEFDGRVFDTYCKQRRELGSIYTGFSLRNDPMICEQNFCWCFPDIGATKYLPTAG
jgi:hypothetical protein